MPKQLRCPVTGKLIDLENPVWRDSVTGKLITPDNLAFRDPVTGRFVEGLRFRDPVTGRIVEEQDGFLIFRSPVTGALMTVEVVPKHDYLHIVGQQLFVPNTTTGQVKSAILLGNTLVNTVKVPVIEHIAGQITSRFFTQPPKLNTMYTVYVFCEENTLNVPLKFSTYSLGWNGLKLDGCSIVGDDIVFSPKQTGLFKGTIGFKTFGLDNENQFVLFSDTGTGMAKCKVMFVECNNEPLTYFEGMKSCKMPVLRTTGKNLFDGDLEQGIYSLYVAGNTHAINENYEGYIVTKKPIKVEPNTAYVISHKAHITELNIAYLVNSNSKYITSQSGNNGTNSSEPLTFTTPSDCHYIKFYMNTNDLNTNIQLEKSSFATSYEPHKTNILSCLEPVELRGIGDVRDTLDVTKSENNLVESVGEVVINGDENWVLRRTNTNTLVFNVENLGLNSFTDYANSNKKLLNNMFESGWLEIHDVEFVSGKSNGQGLLVGIKKDKLESENSQSFKQWLSKNPIKIQYQLAEKAIKTVDLSGNKVPTYLGGTHFTTSSETLAPTFEGDVPIIKPTLRLYEREC